MNDFMILCMYDFFSLIHTYDPSMFIFNNQVYYLNCYYKIDTQEQKIETEI